MTKVVILNCPPRAGKDSVAQGLEYKHSAVIHMEFKAQLFKLAEAFLPFPIDEFYARYESNEKDVAWDKLGGMTCREYMIFLAEDVAKKIFGNRYFGEAAYNNLPRIDTSTLSKQSYVLLDNVIVYSDGGFDTEVQVMIDKLGKENVLILQWSREGCNFDNDSRDFIASFPDNTIRLEDNNSSIDTQVTRAEEAILKYFELAKVSRNV